MHLHHCFFVKGLMPYPLLVTKYGKSQSIKGKTVAHGERAGFEASLQHHIPRAALPLTVKERTQANATLLLVCNTALILHCLKANTAVCTIKTQGFPHRVFVYYVHA